MAMVRLSIHALLSHATCVTRPAARGQVRCVGSKAPLRLEKPAPILRFPSLRQSVYDELARHEQLKGTSWRRFPALTRILKGHRRGELTVLSGPTGSGKTTLLSESSLDLCLQGVKTLWGSFEIRNARLCKLLLTQFAQTRIECDIQSFDRFADAFSSLPMHFMDFHGEQSLTTVLETMSEAVASLDIHHVILDNLQFMIGNECNSRFSHMNRFEYQDLIIGSLRKFATQHDCHVTIVIHPRKQRLDEELTNSSIFGGAKAIQEADNILLLQVRYQPGAAFKVRKFLQVTKNRFDGDLGMIPLSFDKETLCFGDKSRAVAHQEPDYAF